MRKLVVIALLCIAVALLIKESFFQNDKVQNSLLLYNIEALAADNEHIELYQCFFKGSVDCPISQAKVKYVQGGYSLKVQY